MGSWIVHFLARQPNSGTNHQWVLVRLLLRLQHSPGKKDKTDVASPENNEGGASSSPRAMIERAMDTPKKSNRQSPMMKKIKKGGEEEKSLPLKISRHERQEIRNVS